MTTSTGTRRPRAGRIATSVAALLAAGLVVSGCANGDDDVAVPSGAKTPTSTASTTGATVPAQASATPTASKAPGDGWKDGAKAAGNVRVGDTNLIAQATGGSVKVYKNEGDGTPQKTLKSPLPSGAPLTFLALERSGDWLRVLLPVRPNGSQGWVKASQVNVFQSDYRVTVSTGKHQLTVYKAGKVVFKESIGLGSQTTPTPGGVFYIKELLEPPNPGGSYGPYAYGLSGYSDVLDEFLGGDGEIGIHGTNEPGSIGKNVSHGCIRLKNADITKLTKMLPLGAPVQIIT